MPGQKEGLASDMSRALGGASLLLPVEALPCLSVERHRGPAAIPEGRWLPPKT